MPRLCRCLSTCFTRSTPSTLATLLLLALLTGCGQAQPPEPPPDSVLEQGMLQSLMDTGFYEEVALSRVIGRHFSPASQSWTVFACFRFRVADGTQAETCVDSFRALALDNGNWVIAVTIEGVYRWRAIDASGTSTGASAEESTEAAGT